MQRQGSLENLPLHWPLDRFIPVNIQGEEEPLDLAALANLPNPPNEPMELVQAESVENTGTISAINKCQSANAKKLCVYDIGYKLKQMEIYDIGGSYSDSDKDFWFYYSTSVCPGYNYLLNLFVCHRKVGSFAIGVSDSNEIILRKKHNTACLPDSLTWYIFRSAQKDESHYIKTFAFKEDSVKALQNNTLFIPIKIDMNPTDILNNEILKKIKLNHDFGDLLAKQEKSDFILESTSKKQFQAHKIILAAHSPTLRNIIKNSKTNTEFIDINDSDMEILLQFIYTGAIRDVLKQDCLQLLEIANKFQLQNLFLLMQHAIEQQIKVENAVEVAIISEKYGLEHLQAAVFRFIKDHREVLDTDGWKSLDDVKLAKKLFQSIQKSKTPTD